MSTQIQKSTRSQRGWHRTLPIPAVAETSLIYASSAGAVDIQSLTLGSVNNATSSTANGVQYDGKSQSITSFTDANNTSWNLSGGTVPTVILRRSGAAPTDTVGTGTVNNRDVVWGRQQGTGTNPYEVLPSQPTTTQNALSQNNIYSGTDNIFANTGNTPGNHSDVERADFIMNGGVTTNANQAFTVFERGATTGHDGFGIAAITALDANGNPSQYGNLVSFANGSWGKTGLTGNQNYVVINNASGSFKESTTVQGQDIGGVVISLTDLAPANTTIYGYSLFGADVTSSTNLVNYNSFPTNSAESSGGLDLVAANLGVARKSSAVPFEFSPSLGLLMISATWGTQSLWRRRSAFSNKSSNDGQAESV